LARPLLLTIAMPPLLTISAGFESIEMYPADAHIARYAAAAILPNHQECEANFMGDGGPEGERYAGSGAASA
jgi:hypothetical protein